MWKDWRGGGEGGTKGRETPPPSTLTEEQLRALTAHLVVKVRSDAPNVQEQLEGALVAHLWQGDGLYEVRQTPVMAHVRQLAKADTPGLPNVVREGFELRIPKMPKGVLQQVVTFFGQVQEKHKAEAIVQLFWDAHAQGWVVSVPPQLVSGAHVDHNGPLPETAALVPVGEIHSHSSMNAFFSSVDDADEKKQPMRLFGVIGNLDHLTQRKLPTWKWRIFTGSAFVELELGAICDLSEPWQVSITLADVLRGTMNIAACPEALLCEVPAAWLEQVQEKRTVVERLGGERTWGGYAYGGAPRGTYDSRDDLDWWGEGARDGAGYTLERPKWAIDEGISEEKWLQLLEEDARDQSKIAKRRWHKQQARQARDKARDKGKRTRTAAADKAMGEEPPDKPSDLDTQPIGSIVFRGGRWWKKGTDGVWRIDTYETRPSKDETIRTYLNWRDYIDADGD